MSKTKKEIDKLTLVAVMNSQTRVFHPKDRRYRSSRCKLTEIDADNRMDFESGYDAQKQGKPCKFDYPQKREMDPEYPE